MEVTFEAVEVPPKTAAARKRATSILLSGDIGLSAEVMQRGRLLPGTYVALVGRVGPCEKVWLRRTRLLPSTSSQPLQTVDKNGLPTVYGSHPQQEKGIPLHITLHPIPNHVVPTVEYIHLEWVKPPTCLPSGHHQSLPSLPLLPMLVGGIFEHNMTWHCVWHGIDYGTWRCFLGGSVLSQSCKEDHSRAAPAVVGEFIRHRKVGVVGRQTQLTVSHPANSSFRLVPPASNSPSYVANASATALVDFATQALTHPESSLCRILMHGPMGSGKTSAVHHLAHIHNATLLELDATVLALQTPMVSSLERPFLACFTAALHMQPAVVCIKHIERLFPKTLDGPAATRIADFCNALNTLQLEHARVAVVATVVDTARLVPRVRQCFQDEIDMELTALPFRQRLLRSLFPPYPDASAIASVNAILMQHGQQPGDIVSYVRRAIANAVAETGTWHATLSPVDLVTSFRADPAKSPSSSTTASAVTLPNVSWRDIGGADAVKQTLQEMVVWPFEKPEVFDRMGITPPIGLLLFGPPGTGKTMLAKAAAAATMCNFMNVTATDLISSEFGDSEKAVARVFDTARAMSPCIVFFDEFQSMFATRSSAGQVLDTFS
ncbi:hypothetical protein, variant [Aphanomyces invadans]|uniref:AAA+ ATPase domain-containing protein n=1 Tax=Aphanomyces invadans TaxID=157072 RepID=A0A024TWY0_9STRA|nr:hypothetical protein, variant [Aphanomyces invadans]ETV98469.1 hypothetical protein, variant [Aphanomyces invadans]|eukprot:XP_008872666.1 hypothetical protein, variant [Aphanomyces invadans]